MDSRLSIGGGLRGSGSTVSGGGGHNSLGASIHQSMSRANSRRNSSFNEYRSSLAAGNTYTDRGSVLDTEDGELNYSGGVLEEPFSMIAQR
jgi:hypothetical protein